MRPEGLGASPGGGLDRPICPYLVDAQGPWRRSQPCRSHRCSARVPAVPIPALTQKRLCLTAEHPRCEHHIVAVERRGTALATDHIKLEQLTGARFGPTVRLLPVAIDAGSETTSIRDRWRRTPPVAVVGAAVALAVVLMSLAGGSGAPPTAPAASPTEGTGAVRPTGSSVRTSSPSLAPSTALATAPATAPARTPGRTPFASVAPVATPIPTDVIPSVRPLPRGTRQYVVGRRDTLRSIARKLDTTVTRIRELNELGDPPVIAPGQVILVPTR